MSYDLNFIYSFSLLVNLFIIFNYNNNRIHNILYLSSSLALIGFCIMITLYPTYFYKKYNWILNTNLIIFNLILIFIHVLPLYLFYNKHQINKHNIEITVIDTLVLLLLYYILVRHKLHNVYPLNEIQLFYLVIFILIIIYLILHLCTFKTPIF